MKRPPDAEVSMAVEMTTLCQELGCLPGPGGLLEQDSYHVYLLQTVLAARAEKQAMDNARAGR